jgi:protoporphyrinogen oxidase
MMSEREATQLREAKYNQREREFLRRHEGASLTELYLDRYGERIADEYQPFGCGLDSLDFISLNELLKRDGASAAAIEDIGSESSALHVIWKRRILQIRGVPEEPKVFFRVRGGNQGLPEAIAQRLGSRIWTNSPVTSIRTGDQGVQVMVRRTQSRIGRRLPCLLHERGAAPADSGHAGMAGGKAVRDHECSLYSRDAADFSITIEVLEARRIQ